MKFISIILLFCFVTNAFAATGTIRALEQQLDEYNYAMTVEWDQKDEAFAQKQNALFEKAISELYQQGLSNEEVMAVLETRMKNRKVLDALKLKASLMSKTAGPAEMMEVLKDKSLYGQGASWNGDVTIWIVGGVIVGAIAILVAWSSWWDANHVCAKYDEAEECTSDYYCSDAYGCRYQGTSCQIINRCTKYERKE